MFVLRVTGSKRLPKQFLCCFFPLYLLFIRPLLVGLCVINCLLEEWELFAFVASRDESIEEVLDVFLHLIFIRAEAEDSEDLAHDKSSFPSDFCYQIYICD